MRSKFKRIIGVVLLSAILTSTAMACDDRSGDGCVATAPPSGTDNPAFQGDGTGWDAAAMMGGVVAWIGFMWGAAQIVELELPPAF